MPQPVMTPKVDSLTGVTLVIDHAEHDVHDGSSFTQSFQAIAGSLPTAVGEETAIGFVTPVIGNGLIHLVFDAQADDESTLELREAPTVVLGQGTRLALLNRNRNSANTGLVGDLETLAAGGVSRFNVAEAAAANLSGGTILHSERLAIGGSPPFGSVNNTIARADREIVLLPSTFYVIILTNLTANDTNHNVRLNWSEEEGGDFAN